MKLLLHKLKSAEERNHFEGLPSFKLPKGFSYVANILSQIMQNVITIWRDNSINMEAKEGGSGDHSPRNHKVPFVKDACGHGALLFNIT